MIEVPRSDQERHLRAVIPEWLTRPPEHEILRRQRLADEAREDARIALHARRSLAATVKTVVLFTTLVQFALTGTAWLPLCAALGLGLVLGPIIHWLDEGVFVWIVTGVVVGGASVAWLDGPVMQLIGVCVVGIVGAVHGVLRDPVYRI